MIVSFRHKGLKDLFESGSQRGVSPVHVPKLLRILSVLDVASNPRYIAIPGFRAHELRGDMAGFWSVRVSGNWRVTFCFNHEDVELVDYHDYH